MRRTLNELEALAPKIANVATQISVDAQAWRFPVSKQHMTKAE